ncbi:hypothetical protein [Mycolicibacter terrae]|uniref:hypothetical protein n=1 Tax=Mycolicibacter terrae TaxID=1788 RepID=UPI000B94DEFD|nr:hypothetical protein [Mycolicibacter terrae]SNV68680.1 Uncharacterised protein [Mycolicibacter terrae]
MTAGDDGTAAVAAELGAAVAARLLRLEERVRALEAQQPRIIAVGGGPGLVDHAD